MTLIGAIGMFGKVEIAKTNSSKIFNFIKSKFHIIDGDTEGYAYSMETQWCNAVADY